MFSTRSLLLLLAAISVFATSSVEGQAGDAKDPKGMVQKDPPDHWVIPPAPVLSPQEALESFEIVDGFEVQLVASEPNIHDPVAMLHDEDGRIWVVEMRGYMPNVDGTGEDVPNGRISVLDDEDGDGFYESARVFLDELVLPRAVALVKGGILYAEPPNLWFVANREGEAGSKILVDARYAVGGNPEHQPNGLMVALDNWIYSSKGSARYRFFSDRWVKESTEFRGQWGISQDDYGRLFYNSNSDQLRGDWVPPGTHSRNPHHKSRTGLNARVARDQRVYPSRITTGVNRAYRKGIVDDEGRLVRFTSASGPVIFRGDGFPDEFQGNGFVPEPAAYLIKRNILTEEDGRVTSRFAYEKSEFLTSSDERFRPVNLYNGPDGMLYVVDFYRGIIQHRTYMTSYLRRQVLSRDLQVPVGLGRIYRIVPTGTKSRPLRRLSKEPSAAVAALLSHGNGWWRDTAQRVLVERGDLSVVPELVTLAANDASHLGQLHALWTLEGMRALTPDVIKRAMAANHPKVAAAAVRLAQGFIGTENAPALVAAMQKASESSDYDVQLQLAVTAGLFDEDGSSGAWETLRGVLGRRPKDKLLRDAAIGSVAGRESRLAGYLRRVEDDNSELIATLDKTALQVIAARKNKPKPRRPLTETEQKLFDHGRTVYEGTCMTCHQNDGTGVVPLGPPLVDSEWVAWSDERLVRLVLHGLTGPILVNGKVYDEPDYNILMPGIADNDEITDEDIAGALTYVRNSWGHAESAIVPAVVTRIRAETEERAGNPYTQAELEKIR